MNWWDLFFSVMAVWWLLMGLGWFCNRKCFRVLAECKAILDTEPFDEATYRVAWSRLDKWMERDRFLLNVASLYLLRDIRKPR